MRNYLKENILDKSQKEILESFIKRFDKDNRFYSSWYFDNFNYNYGSAKIRSRCRQQAYCQYWFWMSEQLVAYHYSTFLQTGGTFFQHQNKFLIFNEQKNSGDCPTVFKSQTIGNTCSLIVMRN